MKSTENLEYSLSDEASDPELFAAMVAGSEIGFSAFEIFYRRYVDDLYKYIFRVRGLLEHDKWDLVQETMVKAFRSAATFKDVEDKSSDAKKKSPENYCMAWANC